MNLVVDIGNTRLKLALFDGNTPIDKKVFEQEEEALQYAQKLDFNKGIICVVGRANVQSWQNMGCKVLSHDMPLPIQNSYETPHTLGLDRIASAIGAHTLFPDKDVLAIDCGTCITCDLLTKEGIYKGGGISPGIEMKLKALNNFTAALPLVQKKSNVPLIGKTTETSIQSGVINGTIAEISGIIKRYTDISNNLAPVLCGGDAMFIANQLHEQVYVEPDLVLVGLNNILAFNE